MYVLDEPSIGLHQRDNERLLDTLRHLRDLGNSVIVVEHDQDAILLADHVVDMGIGAGEHGGCVVAEGTPTAIQANSASLTGQYLSGKRSIAIPSTRTPPNPERMLTIRGAAGNNLKQVQLNLPVGLLICVTGVSGSGKSTLINDTLYRVVARHLYGSHTDPAAYQEIDGLGFSTKSSTSTKARSGAPPFQSRDLHRPVHTRT